MSVPLGIYRHYKGNLYVVTQIALHTESGEGMVVYYDYNDDSSWWVRPLEMFIEDVDVGGEMVERFEFIGTQHCP